MIKVDPCRGCGRLLYSASLGGLTYRAETDPLDAQQALAAVVGGTELYRVTSTSVSSVTPAVLEALRLRGTIEGPTVVRKHVCTNRGTENLPTAPQTPSQDGGREKVRTPAPKAPAAPSRRSSGPRSSSSTPDSAKSAETPGGDRADCSTCGRPIDLADTGTYALIELGVILIDAFHTKGCPA